MKEKNDISIYTRATGGRIDEFKAVAIVPQRIDVVGMVLRDISAYPQWMSGCKEARIIESFDENNMILYYAQKTPWPLQDRDVVLEAKTAIDWEQGVFDVTLRSIADARMAERRNHIRMREMLGSWRVEYLGQKQSRLTFILKLDPAGAIPAFLVNAGNNNYQYNTLMKLKQILKKPQYHQAAKESGMANEVIRHSAQWDLPRNN